MLGIFREVPKLPMLSPRKSSTRPRRVPRRIRPFDAKAFLAHAGIGRTVHIYNPKQAIFSQGDAADAVFYIQQGRVRLTVVSKQGKEATIALLDHGDFLGEGCIASDQPLRLTTAAAITRCSVLRIEKSQLLRTLHAEHGFSDLFVAYGRTSQSHASGLGRSTVQFERKAAGASASDVDPLRQGR